VDCDRACNQRLSMRQKQPPEPAAELAIRRRARGDLLKARFGVTRLTAGEGHCGERTCQ
jgi:hypothetical protein